LTSKEVPAVDKRESKTLIESPSCGLVNVRYIYAIYGWEIMLWKNGAQDLDS
jgi:hypothetical protein